MAFIVELWESVFTPGTTPALITATHASFILLIISLIVLIFLSKSIHFVNLLVIAILLYGSVIWFINELKNTQLKSNEELEKDSKEEEKGAKTESQDEPKVEKNVEKKPESLATGVKVASPVKKRKV
ncbi:Pkr1-domain-containing protein [Suhomyces tanzawaensis NRRL Y-17324]|uniref:Pkr1-domain-containing protein n=1 Tax=Suhomyces tanzawaensis NRRL Y-17324 TaxID=984487 RepID=A0A1E4SK74_9ASCO|nr:Pkr1-domain-containing protein [Suhomyces tanzawaensis NRRL Y-17324]ODV79909.1 Pkr1-domain-containing protein [Suhomyces tanzawaensis NRRL Y-17324]